MRRRRRAPLPLPLCVGGVNSGKIKEKKVSLQKNDKFLLVNAPTFRTHTFEWKEEAFFSGFFFSLKKKKKVGSLVLNETYAVKFLR